VDLHVLTEIGEGGVTASTFITDLQAARGRDVIVHISSGGAICSMRSRSTTPSAATTGT
jgi:hypothetical protein